MRSRGLSAELERIRRQAEDFREKIKSLPFEIVSESLSFGETPLHPTGQGADKTPVSAYRIFEILKDEYDIFCLPQRRGRWQTGFSGSAIWDILTEADNDSLISALKDMQNRGLL